MSRLSQKSSPNITIDCSLRLPNCPYHHLPIKSLCVSSTCTCPNYAICQQKQCSDMHATPSLQLIDLESFNQVLRSKTCELFLVSEKIEHYFHDVRASILHRLDLDIARSKPLLNRESLPEVLKMARMNRANELTSRQLAQFLSDSNQHIFRAKLEIVRDQAVNRMKMKESLLTSLFQTDDYNKLLLLDIYCPELQQRILHHNDPQLVHLSSRILQLEEHFALLCNMMKQNKVPVFEKITLIHRASEHGFAAEAYHQNVDGKSPTLVLIQTTNKSKFGAFLNCKVTKEKEWICDASGLSFVFSIDHRRAYRLKAQADKRCKAAFGGRQGPHIGAGCDIYLFDKCNSHSRNGANLGSSYCLPAPLQFNSNEARCLLAGSENFAVDEYEVFLCE